MNTNEFIEKLIKDTETSNDLYNKASEYFRNGDIKSLEKLLEANPDSPIILQYIALHKSLLVFNTDLERPVSQNIDIIKDTISNLESAVESLNKLSVLF